MSQSTATLSPDQKATASHLFGGLNWPFSEHAFGSDDLFLTDDLLLPFLDDAQAPCKMASLDSFVPQDANAVDGTIYVLSRQKERHKAKALAKALPEAKVVSATYGDQNSGVKAFLDKGVTLLAATRHSGATYLADMLEENKFCRPLELLTVAQRHWAALQDDFDPVRAVATTLNRSALPSNHKGDIVLQFDPIDYAAMVKRGQVSELAMKRLIKRLGVQALYFVRRNKTQQSLIAMSLSKRDQWDAVDLCSLSKKERKSMSAPDMELVREHVFSLLIAEAMTETTLKASQKLRMMTFEELIESPIEVMKMLGPFLGQYRLKRIRVLDATPELMTTPWFEDAQADMRTELIRFLGLKRTKYGSFTTETLEMLDSAES